MASGNDGVLSNNFGKNSSNYNNNETVTSSTVTMPVTTSNTTERRTSGGFLGGEIRSPRISNIDVHPEVHPRREENPFSFKHFLNRDTTSSSLGSSSNCNVYCNTSTTTTITHSNSIFGSAANTLNNEQYTHSPNNNSSTINDDYSGCIRNDGSTGGLPDVSTTTNSATQPTIAGSTNVSAYQSSTGARPKVPHSIVTSSYQQHPLTSSSISATSMSSLAGDVPKMKRSPRFSSFDSQASLAEFAGGSSRNGELLQGGSEQNPGNTMNNFFPNVNDYDRQYVHRSYSNYDMDVPGKSSDVGVGGTSPRRRTSPVRSMRTNGGACPQSNSSNLGVNLNLNSLKHSNRQQKSQQPSHGSRPVPEFSAALPDFVQDHWMDQFYCSLDMNLHSPPKSPTSPVDFVEDLPSMTNQTEKCQTLPDFLSDGPIIHSSSSRLADVTAGLPGLDSPEDNSPSLQISRLRLENDRLRRELDESRLSLAEQTRRAGELERRLEQARSNESAYSASLAQSMGQVEENLDQSKKRTAAAQSQVTKLKQQVKQLTAELDVLRRENESLREDGAVGGDRVTRRPLRTQQLSRDLMRAASTAENNLRQLLTGVENLRIMAATIENMDRNELEPHNQANPIINDEFLSDCDVDFDDFSGPAL